VIQSEVTNSSSELANLVAWAKAALRRDLTQEELDGGFEIESILDKPVMVEVIHIVADFEAFFSREYSLKKMTSEAYIRGPKYQSLVLALTPYDPVVDHSIEVLRGPDAIAARVAAQDWSSTTLIAQNASFDADPRSAACVHRRHHGDGAGAIWSLGKCKPKSLSGKIRINRKNRSIRKFYGEAFRRDRRGDA
jgi:hypothetical protein